MANRKRGSERKGTSRKIPDAKPKKPRVTAPADAERIAQPHGGALLTSGVKGNPGGGRTPKKLKRKMRENLARALDEVSRRLGTTRIKKMTDKDLNAYMRTFAETSLVKEHLVKGNGPGGAFPVAVIGPRE